MCFFYNVRWCKFIVGDKEYPAASGKTRREAKEKAAKLVFNRISGSKTTDVSYSSVHAVHPSVISLKHTQQAMALLY